jgi:periplasmic divalent cation tolerance protein
LNDHLLVMTTLPDQASAEALGERLVAQHLAACVTIGGPVTSVYRWQGELQRDTERVVTIKTRQARFAALHDAIIALHPYELPEVIAVPITAGHPDYLAWIDTCTET